jgi:hypothetical protein
MKCFFFNLLLATLIGVCSSFSEAALSDNNVLYLTFDEGAGKIVKDQSKNGHDANIIANARWVDGKIGKAIEITAEGQDCVNIPAAETLKIKGEITMMAWVYQNSWAASSAQWFDKNCHNGGEKNSYGIGVFGNNILMMLGEIGSRKGLSVPNAMQDKQWHHIVGTYDSKTKRIYLDGKLLAEQADKFDFAGTNDSDLRIGCSKDRPQYTFDGGSIDEAAMWNRALSLDEIQQAMAGNLLAISPQDKLATTWGIIKQKESNGD